MSDEQLEERLSRVDNVTMTDSGPRMSAWDNRLLDALRFRQEQDEELADIESPRAALLNEAKHLVTGDRNNQYGPPTQDFERAAAILAAIGYRGPEGRQLQAHDIALMVMAVKMSRLTWMPQHEDSWTDIAGYAACGYECSTQEMPPSVRHPLT